MREKGKRQDEAVQQIQKVFHADNIVYVGSFVFHPATVYRARSWLSQENNPPSFQSKLGSTGLLGDLMVQWLIP